MSRNVPPWIRAQLAEAVARGDRPTAKKLTAVAMRRLLAAQSVLHSKPKEPVK